MGKRPSGIRTYGLHETDDAIDFRRARKEKPMITLLKCVACDQTFDLLNSYWKRPLANSKWLHTSGTGHEHYALLHSDGTVSKTVQRRASNQIMGHRLKLVSSTAHGNTSRKGN